MVDLSFDVVSALVGSGKIFRLILMMHGGGLSIPLSKLLKNA